jgi:hypothetical protein
MCPANGDLIAIGYERDDETELPHAVTRTSASVDPDLSQAAKCVGIELTESRIS